MTDRYFIGVDVGTSSARAAVCDSRGKLLASATAPITIYEPKASYYEQSSEEIWAKCCQCVRIAVRDSRVPVTDIKGIGFDATCSLVALDEMLEPVSVSPSNERQQNVIMWMDHRATAEAQIMTNTGHAVLRNTGGKISPEMSAAKLLWLHTHNPTSFTHTAHFIELPDFLTAKATGSLRRSVGLEGVVEEKFKRFGGSEPCLPGESIGVLGEEVKRSMGLEGSGEVAVGGSLIDAYSGALGTLGVSLHSNSPASVNSLSNRMAVICGTSSCHIAVAPEQHFVPGVWGPYASVLLKDFHCAEGGQSATGKSLDFALSLHPYFPTLQTLASKSNTSIYSYLNNHLQHLAKERNLPSEAFLTKDLHVSPDFHGNRSPFADPNVRGAIVGLGLDASLDALATFYLATIQALVYGTRHIISTLNENGYKIDTLFLSGGLTKNALFVKTMADGTGCEVVLPREEDAVLLGSAMLGAAAAGGL
ncbi:hypothetical protein HK097_003925, partial [Rhizophlyctis rosea]